MNELPSVCVSVKRKARKPHTCFGCGVEIKKGNLYSYTSGIWEGSPQSFKHCKDCEKIITNYKLMDSSLDDCDGPALERWGVLCWIEGFFHAAWQGEDAAKELASLFDVPLSYTKKLCPIELEGE